MWCIIEEVLLVLCVFQIVDSTISKHTVQKRCGKNITKSLTVSSKAKSIQTSVFFIMCMFSENFNQTLKPLPHSTLAESHLWNIWFLEWTGRFSSKIIQDQDIVKVMQISKHYMWHLNYHEDSCNLMYIHAITVLGYQACFMPLSISYQIRPICDPAVCLRNEIYLFLFMSVVLVGLV